MVMIASKIAWPAAGFLAAAGALEVADIALPPPISGGASYSEPVVPGEIVLVPWAITKRTECPGETSRVWDGQGNFHLTEPKQATALPAGTITPNIQTKVPEMAPAGGLQLRIVGFFQCEGERRQDFALGPVTFTVER
jgi:hypothetical protein